MLGRLIRDVAASHGRVAPQLARGLGALQAALGTQPGLEALPWIAHERAQLARAYCSAEAPAANLYNTQVRSLAFDRPLEEPTKEAQAHWLTRLLLRVGGFYSKESVLLRGARALYEGIQEQALDKRLLNALHLSPSFAQEHMLLSLHVWMLLVRLRAEGKDGKKSSQMMYEEFTEDVESRLRKTGVKVRISKHLQELEKMFYGSSMAYDKAMRGDEPLSTVLLRNVFLGDPARKQDAGALARYVQWELACLAKTESEHVLHGKIRFSSEFEAVKDDGAQ